VADPIPRVVVGAGDTASPGTHWYPGKNFTVGAAIFKNGAKQSWASITVALLRFDPAIGSLRYLNGSNAWVTGDTPTQHDMAASPGDAKIAIKTFIATDTASWNTEDIFIIATVSFENGIFYGADQITVTSTLNRHDGLAFDPTGLFT
ncbi:MAG: hypothetical protein ABIW84_00315, partial [Ilumatobacteraceae bacterium]